MDVDYTRMSSHQAGKQGLRLPRILDQCRSRALPEGRSQCGPHLVVPHYAACWCCTLQALHCRSGGSGGYPGGPWHRHPSQPTYHFAMYVPCSPRMLKVMQSTSRRAKCCSCWRCTLQAFNYGSGGLSRGSWHCHPSQRKNHLQCMQVCSLKCMFLVPLEC